MCRTILCKAEKLISCLLIARFYCTLVSGHQRNELRDVSGSCPSSERSIPWLCVGGHGRGRACGTCSESSYASEDCHFAVADCTCMASSDFPQTQAQSKGTSGSLGSGEDDTITATDAAESTTTSRLGGGAVVLYSPKILEPFHLPSRTFHLAGRDFSIKQNWADFGVAAVVWDAAVVLCEYLEAQIKDGRLSLEGKQVIELGAGTGLVGMVAATLHGTTTVTDRKSFLEPLWENINLNFQASENTASTLDIFLTSSSSSSSSVPSGRAAPAEKPFSSSLSPSTALYSPEKMPAASPPPHPPQPPTVRALDWGENLGDFTGPYDVILGADIIYIEESFPALLQTLVYLSNEETLILLSCRIRYNRDERFLKSLEEEFEVQHVLSDHERGIQIYSARKLSS